MRIDALVSQVLAQLQPLAAQSTGRRPGGGAGGAALQLLAAGSAGDRAAAQRGLSDPSSASSSIARSTSPRAAADSAEISPGARLGSAALDDAENADADLSVAASLVDALVRQRAIVAYSLPGKGPFGANIDIILDVETTYRRTDLLLPRTGQSLDVQA
jgi:hypothetical protein